MILQLTIEDQMRTTPSYSKHEKLPIEEPAGMENMTKNSVEEHLQAEAPIQLKGQPEYHDRLHISKAQKQVAVVYRRKKLGVKHEKTKWLLAGTTRRMK